MKNSGILYGSLLLLSVLFSSCGPTLSPFTQQLYEDNNWSTTELQQIQFYLSDDIVLQREFAGGSSEIIQGEIRMVNGRQVEQVTFRRGTPGVFVFSPKQNRFAVSFEGGDDRFLMFGPSPKARYRYVLMARDWNHREGIVTYAGKKWRVDSNSAYAALLVDLDRMNQTDFSSRIVTGRKVN